MLESLENEKNFYEMKQILPLKHDVFGEEDRKDILEHWSEDKLDEWRSTYHYIFYSLNCIFIHHNFY
jgi:hypothetical protein